MIVPGQFNELIKKPVLNLAWVLLLLNLTVFLFTNFLFSKWPSETLIDKVKDKNFSTSLVEMHQQTLDPIEKIDLTKSEALMTALRDHRFWKKVSTFPFKGDQVQIEKNRVLLVQFQDEYFSSAQYNLGLGSIQNSPWSWITYQFTHVSFFHLLGNVIFIFLIVAYLESFVGLVWIAAVFLLGGFSGGACYLYLEGAGSMAMIGASAGASALMAFLVIAKNNKPIPWSYFIAPVPGGYGRIYLPAFLIFPFFIMTDFISYLWEPSGVQSSIAVSAHIGGALAGLTLGAFYLTEQKLKNYFLRQGIISENELTDE